MARGGGNWQDWENDAVVADYFSMLASELAGKSYSKAEHNEALQKIIPRSRGSIEYKHQNISAVLIGLGETRIHGYKPAFKSQSSLEDAVMRWLNKHPEWTLRGISPTSRGLSASDELWIGPIPTRPGSVDPADLAKAAAIAKKYDVAQRDERNRALGRAGEQLVLARERSVLQAAGRSDLAAQVRWVSEEDGDGAGYDIASFEIDGKPRLIEVKTTNGLEFTPFYISANERAVSESRSEDWCLLRVWDFARSPKAFELRAPLENHVRLKPTAFLAVFN